MLKFLFAFVIILSPLAGIAQEASGAGGSGYVRVVLEFKSMFPGTVQVLDKVCKDTRNVECAKASIKANGEACQQNPGLSECKEAKDLLDTSFCMEGFVYEGRISSGEKISVDLCMSAGGYGNMSVRDVAKGPIWTNYSLLSDGQTISYP